MTPTPEPTDGLVVGQEVLLVYKPQFKSAPNTHQRARIERLTDSSVFAGGVRFDRKPRVGNSSLSKHGQRGAVPERIELCINPSWWDAIESKGVDRLLHARRQIKRDSVAAWLATHATHADLDALEAMMAKGKEEGK